MSKKTLNIEIVPLDMKNIDGVLDVDKLSFSVPWSRQALLDEIDNDLAKYIVAMNDGKVIGYAGIWLIAGEGQITNIAVHPDFRKMGVAGTLLETLIGICRTANIKDITLEVRKSNIAAQKLYEKYGFLKKGLRKNFYPDNNEDALIMWKHDV